ncbi:MAG: adenosylmethionine decarboxylase [Candidatus Freyarchaeota archaeon]|nr:adenosylmethionine decarboxylase [Candidatus Freyrarchaeum guaymaensis]
MVAVPRGHHIISEVFADPEVLDDLEFLKDTFLTAAEIAGLQILDVKFHKFEPMGVSGILLISESHVSIHTWPEDGYAAIDIFTCGDVRKCWEAYQYIISRINARHHIEIEIKRGLLDES